MTSESEFSASITYAAMFFQPQKLKFHKMFRNILTPRSPSFIPRVLPASGISERRATQPARKNENKTLQWMLKHGWSLDPAHTEFHIIGKAGKVVRLVRVTKILRVFKLVRHFAGLQSLFFTIRKAAR